MKELLASSVISGLIGVFLGFFIQMKDSPTLFQWFVLLLLILICLIALAYFGPLKLIFRSNNNFYLSGEWNSKWWYLKNNSKVEVTELVNIKQYGQYVSGTARSVRIDGNHPFPSLTYGFQGSVSKDGVLEGTWKNIEKGKRYRGVLQGTINKGGQIITISWLGVDNSGIHSGQAEWLKK